MPTQSAVPSSQTLHVRAALLTEQLRGSCYRLRALTSLWNSQARDLHLTLPDEPSSADPLSERASRMARTAENKVNEEFREMQASGRSLLA